MTNRHKRPGLPRSTPGATCGTMAAMVPEAPLEQTEAGRVPKGDGWFVLNARDARWRPSEGRGAYCVFEGEPEFPQARNPPRLPRARRADGDVPLGGRSGRLPGALGRGAADRGRGGAVARAMGFRPLSGEREARHPRGRQRAVPRARGRGATGLRRRAELGWVPGRRNRAASRRRRRGGDHRAVGCVCAIPAPEAGSRIARAGSPTSGPGRQSGDASRRPGAAPHRPYSPNPTRESRANRFR